MSNTRWKYAWAGRSALGAVLCVVAAGAALHAAGPVIAAARGVPQAGEGIAALPGGGDASDIYAATRAGMLAPAVRGDLERIYVPDLRSNDVTVIDPARMKIVDRFKVGRGPQHIVPAYDLRTLWVTNNSERTNEGSLTPIDPRSGKPGTAIAVDDPYNMYATPDGKSAIVVAEAKKRLDFRDPRTMALQYSIEVPGCPGINHADFANDGRTAYFTCEFSGTIAKIDLAQREVLAYLHLQLPPTRLKETKGPRKVAGEPWTPGQTEICTARNAMPQDIRFSPDGRRLYVADMHADGVHVIDAATFRQIGFVTTGLGTHGLYPSRDGKLLYVANRGTHAVHGKRRGEGGVTVIDFASGAIVARWPVPGGGSPDMGNVSADGKYLWLSGRFDDVVYRFDTATGAVAKLEVGAEPHGLTVWPQPGRYSLGHTGNMR